MNTHVKDEAAFGAWRKSSHSHPNGNDCIEIAWRKSSRSNPNGNNCVEVGWHKSTHSGPNGNDCVEVAFGETAVGLRDSKNPTGPKLTFAHTPWLTFLTTSAT
jgi:hypothetical protein